MNQGKSFQIQTSIDNLHWTEAFATTDADPKDRGVREISFPPVAARYVRFYGTERASRYGYSLFEFEVFAEGTVFDPLEFASLALNKPVTASSTRWRGAKPERAVNGFIGDW